ncbi:hypothetical protein GGQ64_005539 [Rhizobium azooxidifex]|uniref:Uncharacterized protein n=1 Tax=Mycoplana azooxidifex TaxID=1636188 RepID=A0A7W6DBK5_9HYPH|nr:hypothetical protein [Mycoplana azooxidifex]MBB3980286.1 hypothetical protein [Mycoplana azooxidifex]
MSSHPSFTAISPSEMEMIQSVLAKAGYDDNVLKDDQQHSNAAALLVMKLFRAGETSPHALSAQLEYNFGKASRNKLPYQSPFARYAIQGLPRNLREHGRVFSKVRARSIEADEQSWENEGGAVGHTRACSPLLFDSTIALALKGERQCLTDH